MGLRRRDQAQLGADGQRAIGEHGQREHDVAQPLRRRRLPAKIAAEPTSRHESGTQLLFGGDAGPSRVIFGASRGAERI